jgi:hypothetical protein
VAVWCCLGQSAICEGGLDRALEVVVIEESPSDRLEPFTSTARRARAALDHARAAARRPPPPPPPLDAAPNRRRRG